MEIPKEEQINRNREMQERLKRYNVEKWAESFVYELNQIKKVQREFRTKDVMKDVKKLLEDYRKSSKRLLLLDYDETLVPHVDDPREAKPDNELINILAELSKGSTIVIVSGRDRKTLEEWFKKLGCRLSG